MLLSFSSFSLALGMLVAQAAPAAAPVTQAAPAATIPAHTNVQIHLTKMVSSHDAETGQKFSFVVDQDVTQNGVVIIPKCTSGSGTITLAGKHGINGHEGNLHLRFDSLVQSDGSSIALDPTEQQFNGTQRKAMAFFTTRWINGDDVEVKPDKVITIATMTDTPVHPGVTATCPAPEPSSAPASQR